MIHVFDRESGKNIQSELRFSYGDEYWDLLARIGGSAEYALEVV
jgi:hypothetical protein